MTSLTGTTEQTLAGTVNPPTLSAALAGSVAQFAVLANVWLRATPLGTCAAEQSAAACWADPWSRQVVLTLALGGGLWLVGCCRLRVIR